MRHGTGLWGNVKINGSGNGSSETAFYIIFEKELAEGENDINIGVPLKSGYIVYLNGSPLDSQQWSGIGTTILTLPVNGSQYDKLIVVGNYTGLFEKELADNETDIPVGFEIHSYSQVFLNGKLLMTNRWSGAGTTTLTLLFPVQQYDKVKLVNRIYF